MLNFGRIAFVGRVPKVLVPVFFYKERALAASKILEIHTVFPALFSLQSLPPCEKSRFPDFRTRPKTMPSSCTPGAKKHGAFSAHAYSKNIVLIFHPVQDVPPFFTGWEALKVPAPAPPAPAPKRTNALPEGSGRDAGESGIPASAGVECSFAYSFRFARLSRSS